MRKKRKRENRKIEAGDLVTVNQDIPEYVAERGGTPGVIIGDYDPSTTPQLFSVLWPDGEVEALYEDELQNVTSQS